MSPGPGRPTGPNSALLAKAHLAPCPLSSDVAVSGGLPNVTLNCLGAGPAVHLAGLTGKPTVVNLWGSWCGPCGDEASYLAAVYDRDKAAVRFLGVDIEDDDNSALSFAARVSAHYPSVVDPDKKVLIALHYAGPPETVLLNRAGKIVHIHTGAYGSARQLFGDLATYLHVGLVQKGTSSG